MAATLKVAVIGAGIVGVSTALWLRRDGHDVTLYDRIDPGNPAQTSYGNAGLIARSSVIPVPVPGLRRLVPRMLLSRDGPLFLKWRYLPKLAPWLIPFLRGARPEAVRRTATALTDLLGDAVDEHLALARGTDAERFIRTGAYIFLYRDRAAFEKDAFGFGLREELGFTWDELDGAALRENDPALSPEIGFGAAVPDHGWIVDPGGYVRALYEEFRRLGGTFRRGEVDAIEPGETGAIVVCGGDGEPFDRIALTAGVWSRRLAERIGHHVPLESERGYHLMFKGASVTPPCPYMVTDSKIAVTPMADGVRCAGLVEFGGTGAPPSTAPLGLIRRRIQRLYPGLSWEHEDHWMGHRPSTIDSLPLIGESAKAPGIYFGFGAQHIGLTSGPKTGRLIAALIGGGKPNMDLSPFAPGRFDRV